jgi:hypothetical protein
MGFRWFTGQIVPFFRRQMKRWPIMVLAVTRMFCTVIQSCVNDCVFFRISVRQIFLPKLSAVFSQLAACNRTLGTVYWWGMISDYRTSELHPENPRGTQSMHPCLLRVR